MLDLKADSLIPLTAVPAFLTERGFRSRYGKPVALRTVQEWAALGKLETTTPKCGGVRHTTIEALERMLEGEKAGTQKSETGRRDKRVRRVSARRQARADALKSSPFFATP